MKHQNMPKPVCVLTLSWEDVEEKLRDMLDREPSREEIIRAFGYCKDCLKDDYFTEHYGVDLRIAVDQFVWYKMPEERK